MNYMWVWKMDVKESHGIFYDIHNPARDLLLVPGLSRYVLAGYAESTDMT